MLFFLKTAQNRLSFIKITIAEQRLISSFLRIGGNVIVKETINEPEAAWAVI